METVFLCIYCYLRWQGTAKKAHFHLTPIFLKYFFIHEARVALICKYVMRETENYILDMGRGQVSQVFIFVRKRFTTYC